jgi:hypothetical protein
VEEERARFGRVVSQIEACGERWVEHERKQ